MKFIGEDHSITTIHASRSLERPNGFDEEIDCIGGPWGNATASSIVVNENTALAYSAIWRAVNLVSKDVARTPLEVFKRLPDDRGKERDFMHPAFRLLKERSSPAMTALHFKTFMQACVLMRGNAYAFIDRDARGAISSLVPLENSKVKPFMVNSEVAYEMTADKGGKIVLPAESVLHLRGLPSFTSKGLEGMSVLQAARESFGLGLAARQHQAYFFSNSSRPSILLEYPGMLEPNEQQALITSWERFNSGLRNAHRTVVLEGGMQAKPITINSSDAELLATRKFEIREIANWFSIPAFKLQESEGDTSFASLEIQQQAYLDEGLDSWLAVWEDECREKLLTSKQRAARSHVIEFNRNSLLRADLATRFDAYGKAIIGGWMTPNEVRKRENLPAVDGGDSILIPLNVSPADEPNNGNTQPGGPAANSTQQN